MFLPLEDFIAKKIAEQRAESDGGQGKWSAVRAAPEWLLLTQVSPNSCIFAI
jgi:hypothetical protein